MLPIHYKEITDYEALYIRGIKGLYTNFRIDRKTLPTNIKALSIRDGEDDFFSTLEEKVLINHMGDFLTCEVADTKDFYMDINGIYSYLDNEETEKLKNILLR